MTVTNRPANATSILLPTQSLLAKKLAFLSGVFVSTSVIMALSAILIGSGTFGAVTIFLAIFIFGYICLSVQRRSALIQETRWKYWQLGSMMFLTNILIPWGLELYVICLLLIIAGYVLLERKNRSVSKIKVKWKYLLIEIGVILTTILVSAAPLPFIGLTLFLGAAPADFAENMIITLVIASLCGFLISSWLLSVSFRVEETHLIFQAKDQNNEVF